MTLPNSLGAKLTVVQARESPEAAPALVLWEAVDLRCPEATGLRPNWLRRQALHQETWISLLEMPLSSMALSKSFNIPTPPWEREATTSTW